MGIKKARPKVICLCGSSRFKEQFLDVMRKREIEGDIVISMSFYGHCENTSEWEKHKEKLDELHLRKIDLADSIYVVNVGGYIGASTTSEMAYAISKNKVIEFLMPKAGERFMQNNSHLLGRLVAKHSGAI